MTKGNTQRSPSYSEGISSSSIKKDLWVEEISLIWKTFCELHQKLLEITCREYQLLLQSRMEALDEVLKTKVGTIYEIKKLEIKRKDIVKNLPFPIKKTSELIEYMKTLSANKAEQNNIKKYNDLLIETIAKIQEQNKKNQMFINKARHNLRNIREEVLGQKPTSTYDSKGKQQGQHI